MDKPNIPCKRPIIVDETPGPKSWCTCGNSQKQPYCDGSHRGSTFSPLRVEIPAAKKVAWCGCKHSKQPPFCDGSHSSLP